MKVVEGSVMIGDDERIWSPNASLAELAAARRIELARNWLTASQVNALLGSDVGDASELVNLRRREGYLLGAWAPGERSYRYPPWQFRPDGQPLQQLKEILRLLREAGGMTSTDGRTSGWKDVEWFLVPHVLLARIIHEIHAPSLVH